MTVSSIDPITGETVIVTVTTQPPTTDVESTDTGDVESTDAGDVESTATGVVTVGPTTTLPSAPLRGLALELITTTVQQPTYATAPPGDQRLFIVERFGSIRLFDPVAGTLPEPFIDLGGVVLANGIEQGLLGLAFHPDYESNGRFYVYHTNKDGHRQLAEYTVSDDPNRADPNSQRVLFAIPQPPDSVDIRHYGGMVQFGPDGFLYVSLGDGADARGQGQDPNTVFASILRLDVDGTQPYAIPADNPFVDGGGAPEVFLYGLRNPWRFSIDPEEGLIYIGDVGQEDREEIDVVSLDEGGANLGWPATQGTRCFIPPDCDPSAYTLPVLEYTHEEGCSVTGGHVYRGTAIPELKGHYFYADWCGEWVRSFLYAGGTVTEQQDWSSDLPNAGQVNSFGVDGFGELLITNFGGTVARIVPVR